MANIIPEQTRVVDPFTATNSNVVNRLSELVTHDDTGFLTPSCIEVIADSTAPDTAVVVTPGYIVKDDVLIKITENHTVDFTDNDNWVTTPDSSFSGGNCYLVLQYKYLKQRPAPEATIRILQPFQRSLLDIDPSYSLLKVIKLSTVAPHYITDIYNYDPESGYESNARKYIQYYAGTEVNLPVHDADTDRGKIVYELERNKFFFGYNADWTELAPGGVSVNMDTDSTGLVIGQLCYVGSSGQSELALADDLDHGADFIIQSIGSASEGTGKGIVCGFAENVIVEPGTIVYIGDLLYLSASTPGAVTNIRPTIFAQVVGRALTQGSSASPIDMIFSPKDMKIYSESGQITAWSYDFGSGLYFHDIDVSALDSTGVFDCSWFDDDTKREVDPEIVEIVSEGIILRVYMLDGTSTINYMIQSPASAGGGGGSGGGGGTVNTDHSVLLNLSYAASGHTGFAPSPHNNTHHSETYITSTDVTFGNLNINGDVGTTGTQVAFGNHTHPEYIDINSGDDILFVEDTARTGYTLLTSIDDALIYITKGSGAGGDAGGSYKSGGTWTQPSHNHGITSVSNHYHSTASHALSINEMPIHSHSQYRWNWKDGVGGGSHAYAEGSWGGSGGAYIVSNGVGSTGAGWTHNHGNTNSTGGHDHGGATGNGATASSWRPRGLNVTRQRRI
jgi:hypothetical protein